MMTDKNIVFSAFSDKLKGLALVLLASAAVGATVPATPINQEHRYSDLTNLPPERIRSCRAGCYVLTFDELMAGLRAAREAGRRERK